MKSNLSCNVVQDLLPQYAEKLLSPESEAEIRAHLAECPRCREVYGEMTSPEPVPAEAPKELDYLKKIRRSRLRLLICSLCAVAIVTLGAVFFLQHQRRQADAELKEQENRPRQS